MPTCYGPCCMKKVDTSAFPKDRLTFVTFHDDNTVTAYLGSVSLGNYDTREQAEHEAKFIISAYDNGALWARAEFPMLAR